MFVCSCVCCVFGCVCLCLFSLFVNVVCLVVCLLFGGKGRGESLFVLSVRRCVCVDCV